MKILVLGGYGGMGSVAVQDLAESGAEVIVAGRDRNKAIEFASRFGIEGIRLDGADKNFLQELREINPDVLVNATWYEFNMQIMPAAIKAGVNYIDLGGLYHTTLKQLKLNKQAKDAGVLCLIGMGSTPGTTNVIANYAAQKFDAIERVEIRSGWRVLEKLRKPIIPYAVRTVLDEFLMLAPVFRGGKIRFVKPLKSKISFSFPAPLGKVSGHYTIHSELATLPKNLDKGVKEMDFVVAYPIKFTNLVEQAIRKYKSREKQIKVLQSKTVTTEKDPRDIDGQRVDVYGKKGNKKLFVRIDSITSFHERWQMGTSIDTGVPPSIAAQWIAGRKIDAKGVLPPEIVFRSFEKEYFKELYKRDGKIKVFESINKGSYKPLFV